MALEFSERIRRIPAYPAAAAYAVPEDVAQLASNESPDPPLPAVVEAITRTLGTLNRYPDPTNHALRRALSDRHGVPAARIAIGNGSCDVLLAAGDALLEPGAELVHAWPSFSVYPHLEAASGARAIRVPAQRARGARPRRDAARDHRRHADGHRLQPEQPDEHGAAARRDRRLRRAGPAPRRRPARRGLLRVLDPRRPRRVGRPAGRATATSCSCGPSARSTGCAACASATRCAATSASCRRSTRSASRSSATPPPRRPRSRRCATRTRSRPASSGRSSRASRSSSASRTWGSSPPPRRRTSAGSTCRSRTARSPRPRRPPSSPAWRARRSSSAPARRWASRARCA